MSGAGEWPCCLCGEGVNSVRGRGIAVLPAWSEGVNCVL